jgi:V/A-type H+-transporting ATPase subunit F
MEYCVIADEDTVLGFRYAGVEGRVVNTPEEARAALRELESSSDTGVVIITDQIAEAVSDEVNRLRFRSGTPILVQIPGPDGPAPGRPDLTALIREAMGVKI